MSLVEYDEPAEISQLFSSEYFFFRKIAKHFVEISKYLSNKWRQMEILSKHFYLQDFAQESDEILG